MKIENPIRKIRKAKTPSCMKCVHSRFKGLDTVTIYCACPEYRDWTERMEGKRYGVAESCLVRGTRQCRFEQKPAKPEEGGEE